MRARPEWQSCSECRRLWMCRVIRSMPCIEVLCSTSGMDEVVIGIPVDEEMCGAEDDRTQKKTTASANEMSFKRCCLLSW